jgi:hypothetical protein
MYNFFPRFVLAFHGFDEKVAESILAGNALLKPSENLYDWLCVFSELLFQQSSENDHNKQMTFFLHNIVLKWYDKCHTIFIDFLTFARAKVAAQLWRWPGKDTMPFSHTILDHSILKNTLSEIWG